MRLKSIKLAGFKSFVDQTTVPFPGQLTAVVGPNGCGKSNIIDAVKWVMGESSAKQLRGESLDDVIFNGSTSRKPVGQASIELCFDNSAGTLGGQYGAYAEIVIRREIARDGQSNYHLNGTRCRRKDITDLFLGTGLGPRSYAIIEQGTISRVVDAKPEELRAFVEEAAGISKYKERRRETEARIENTQENLQRLSDLRAELARQLNHLQRQATAAEKYQVLKGSQQTLQAQLLTLRYRALSTQLAEQDKATQTLEAHLATAIEALQTIEANLEQQREQQTSAHATVAAEQAKFYETSGEVARLEQNLQHQREQHQRVAAEHAEAARALLETQQQLEQVQQQTAALTQAVAQLAPAWEMAVQTSTQSREVLKEAEQALHKWQHGWEQFNRETAQSSQQIQVEKTRIHHLEQHLANINQRSARLEQEQHNLQSSQPIDDEQAAQKLQELDTQRVSTVAQLQALLTQINAVRASNQQYIKTLDAAKGQLQTLRGQQASLQALQVAALGEQKGIVAQWLEQQHWHTKERLAQLLQVDPGWEAAVETVLSPYLQAIYLDNLQTVAQALTQLPRGNLSLVARPLHAATCSLSFPQHATLASKVQAPFSLNSLLMGIYCVETVSEALSLSSELAAHESVITREGIWLGNGWLRIAGAEDAKTGVLQRKRELAELDRTLIAVTDAVTAAQQQLDAGHAQLHEAEIQRDAKQRAQNELSATISQLQAQQQVQQARLKQVAQRAQQIHTELADCAEQRLADEHALNDAQAKLAQATQATAADAQQRETLLQDKINFQAAVDATRATAATDQQQVQQAALQLQAAKLQCDNSHALQRRLEQQLQTLQQKKITLEAASSANDAPLLEIEATLTTLIAQRDATEQTLLKARTVLETLEQQLRVTEQQRHVAETTQRTQRDALEQARLQGQASAVRAATLEEQLIAAGHDLSTILATLAVDSNEANLDEELNQVTRKIERLGPINLAAIEEYAEQAERKAHLDAQQADLEEALQVLESAMQKIDKETRARFRETFEQVNTNFQALFPSLFGGGRASLELDETDLLAAGVNIMAQPPGKRNSTIHLLSGGEKALTAVALVFSFFQLNPAPFCMLDEVDAPLDDANVGRFCQLVQKMAEHVQFIFISHNKLAIAMATHLAGVTMKEPGVSRLVAVDVEEAIALAQT